MLWMERIEAISLLIVACCEANRAAHTGGLFTLLDLTCAEHSSPGQICDSLSLRCQATGTHRCGCGGRTASVAARCVGGRPELGSTPWTFQQLLMRPTHCCFLEPAAARTLMSLISKSKANGKFIIHPFDCSPVENEGNGGHHHDRHTQHNNNDLVEFKA